VAVTLFWGGWLRPFPNVAWLEIPLNFVFPLLFFVGTGLASLWLVKRLRDTSQKVVLVVVALGLIATGALLAVPIVNHLMAGLFWFLLKVSCFVYVLVWFRGTFPRLRYDQLMNIGWKIAIPVGMAAVMINAALGMVGK